MLFYCPKADVQFLIVNSENVTLNMTKQNPYEFLNSKFILSTSYSTVLRKTLKNLFCTMHRIQLLGNRMDYAF